MHDAQGPNASRQSRDDFAGDVTPPTEPKGELIVPPRKPPVAISAAPIGPEPRPPRPFREWGTRRRRSNMPQALVEAVDNVLDVLDSISDTVREAVGMSS